MRLLLPVLREHPGKFPATKLRARLTAVGGDGAAARGGENSIRSSMVASQLLRLESRLTIKALSEWDLLLQN